MSEDRFLISPPPGLLPPPRETAPEPAPVATGSETRRIGAVGIPVVTPAIATTTATTVAPAASSTSDAPAVAPGPGPWAVRLPDGTTYELGSAGLVLGRNPAAPAAHPDAVPVRIDDPGKSVSKTHALLVPEGERIRVLDLRSTNGVALTPRQGDATVVPPEGLLADEGTVIALGDYTVALGRRPGREGDAAETPSAAV